MRCAGTDEAAEHGGGLAGEGACKACPLEAGVAGGACLEGEWLLWLSGRMQMLPDTKPEGRGRGVGRWQTVLMPDAHEVREEQKRMVQRRGAS